MRRLGVVIAGPTGIGKTDVAERLALLLGGELVSVDSVQVYRGLSIGANKSPTVVPQHMLDIASAVHHDNTSDRLPFSAAEFVERACTAISDVLGRGKVPILVGGTGLYMDWIVCGRPSAPASDPAVKAEVEREVEADSDWAVSLSRLSAVDPQVASNLLPNDYYRLVRALTVHRMTGRPLSSYAERRPVQLSLCGEAVDVDWRCFFLAPTDRVAFMRHLDVRCEAMVLRGLLSEVLSLASSGALVRDSCAGRAIGYEAALDLFAALKATVEQRKEVGSVACDTRLAPDAIACCNGSDPTLRPGCCGEDDADTGPEEMPKSIGLPKEAADACDRHFVTFLHRLQAETRQYARRQDRWFAHASRARLFVRVPRDLGASVSDVAEAVRAAVTEEGEMPSFVERADEAELRRYSPVLSVFALRQARDAVLQPILARIVFGGDSVPESTNRQ